MATLAEIRVRAADELGRYDLVDSSYGDNGMNAQVNAAVRKLDSMFITPMNRRKVEGSLGLDSSDNIIETISGNAFVGFELMRAIDKLEMLRDGELSRIYEIPVKIHDNEGIWDTDPYATTWYNTEVNGNWFKWADIDDNIIGWNDYNPSYSFLELLFTVYSTDKFYATGVFFSPELTSDSGTNYWLQVHPEAVIYAIGYVLEVKQRNLSGALEWEKAIQDLLRTDKNLAASRFWNASMEMRG